MEEGETEAGTGQESARFVQSPDLFGRGIWKAVWDWIEGKCTSNPSMSIGTAVQRDLEIWR